MAYTNIDDPSAYFQTATYTGDGSTSLAITNDGNSDLKPDFAWFKRRDAAVNNSLFDSSRGATKMLYSDLTNAEYTNAQSLKTFNTDGFTLGNYGTINVGSGTFVAWQWKANGGTVTTVAESGSNPGFTRQTNTTAGFSIIAYTGTGSNGTIAHGLPSTPEFIIFKRRNNANFWCVWHQAIGDDYKLALQSSDGLDADGAFMASTLPTSTNITVGGASVNTNADNGTYICYAFNPIQGYSKFGKYVGNANVNGPFVYTGFKPAWVMVKGITSNGYHWRIHDNKRDPHNEVQERLTANSADAAYAGTSGNDYMDFLSNGFKLRSTRSDMNVSAITYVYFAFAENPFVTSTGIPTTAR